MKLSFTDKALRDLKLPPGTRQILAWDTKQKGFGYLLGPTGGSFVVSYQKDGFRRREVIGRREDLTLPDARKKAQVILGTVADQRPTPLDLRRANGPTLAEAVADYLEALRNGGARPSSISTIVREISNPERSYLRPWLDRHLRHITARECREKHAELSVKSGKHLANRVLRNFRTIWNHVAREALVDDTTWPPNPTVAVNWHSGDQVGFIERRREPIPWSKLPTWKTAVDSLSPIRRDYNLLVLLTGLRRTDAATLRWQHINLTDEPIETVVWHAGKQAWEPFTLPRRSILRPAPKGGSSRAFVIPLSWAIVQVLERRRAENRVLRRNDAGWVFPARCLKVRPCAPCADLGVGGHVAGTVIHMQEPKEGGSDIPSPHRLRDTYVTAGGEARVPEYDVKVLVNHKWGNGDVTSGYRKQDLEYLRECQEKISNFLVSKFEK